MQTGPGADPLAHAASEDRLMVIIPDRLSLLLKKGEVTPRYYNPGNLFRHVDILMTNDDRPDPESVRPMVGDATVAIHNLPAGTGTFAASLGWRPLLLGLWAKPAVRLAGALRPSLIRCHGNNLNGFAALAIKKAHGVPYVVSLHGNPDVDYNRGRLGRTWQRRIAGIAIESIEIASVRNADLVIPVYSPIIPYLDRHGVSRREVVYNVVETGGFTKTDYAIGDRVRLVCVGRQESMQKDPTPIVEAVARLPRAELTLIGDGDLHEDLKTLSRRLGVEDRVRFVPRMPNSEVLRELARADIYVYCSDNWEISKTCLEASLMGLPIILNHRTGGLARELVGDHVLAVEQSAEGFRSGLAEVIGDPARRAALGRRAAELARQFWDPGAMEAKVVEIYRRLVAAGRKTAP